MEKSLSVLENYMLQFDLITPKCFEEIFFLFNFTNYKCMIPLFLKALGIAIIFGSTLVKLPQVIKIWRSRSSEGLSLMGTLLELLSATACGVYSYVSRFPFTSYGEILFLSIQTALVATLILQYSKGTFTSFLFVVSYAALTTFALTLPKHILWYGQTANIPVAVSGKLLQVIANCRNGHTGQLSALTIFLIALGSFARIFTSIQETGDNVVILSYVSATTVNVILAIQVLYYWKSSPSKSKKKRKAN
uniref:Mannose-P-dolichol utilization defect 1 protein homolog n=1 Tax=Lepeophtheirus salmonis TaxID=72036 RepID=D3PK00_LEPSM|nr:Mannose-P-dolichol utilization defect 1 protein [Lepeophtheirus salmonis]